MTVDWWQMLLEILGGMTGLYLLLLLALWTYARRHPDTVEMRDALRLLPTCCG